MGAWVVFVGWLLNSQHSQVRGREILLYLPVPCPLSPCKPPPQLSVSQSHVIGETVIFSPPRGQLLLPASSCGGRSHCPYLPANVTVTLKENFSPGSGLWALAVCSDMTVI